MVTKEKIDKWQKRKKIELHTQYAKDKNGFELKNKKCTIIIFATTAGFQ